MPLTTIMQKGPRASRVKLGGTVLVLLLLENGRQIRGRISQLSANGGLVSLALPLDEGIGVTVLFHIGCTTIRSKAQMMFPMWATNGCLQPFRFLASPETSGTSLDRELKNLVRRGASEEEVEDIE